jgi:hypothetical protein
MSKIYNNSASTAKSRNLTLSSSSVFSKPLSPYLKPSFAQLTQKLRNEFNKSYELSKLGFYQTPEKLPSLNQCKKETIKQQDNFRLLKRILDTKPIISRRSLESEWRKNQSYITIATQYGFYKMGSIRQQDVVSDGRKSDSKRKFSYKVDKTKSSQDDGRPETNLQDYIDDDDESKVEFEVTEIKKTGILKPNRSNRPNSKVLFEESTFVMNIDDKPVNSNKRFLKFRLPSTTTTPATTPFGEDEEFEIIYENQSRNEFAEPKSVSRVDRDRIKLMYDDKRNNDSIHVVYNDESSSKFAVEEIKYEALRKLKPLF